jgi:drug/metabolite transporter (DMT)-like permease
VIYLATFGTVIAFWLFYWLLGRMESSLPMMISVVTPLIAVLLGWAILDETLPPLTFIGGLLIMTSIGLTLFKRRTT